MIYYVIRSFRTFWGTRDGIPGRTKSLKQKERTLLASKIRICRRRARLNYEAGFTVSIVSMTVQYSVANFALSDVSLTGSPENTKTFSSRAALFFPLSLCLLPIDSAAAESRQL